MTEENEFAERMKVIIRKVGSADKLSKLSGISATIIGKYSSGLSDPTRKKLIALAKAADVSLEWLAAGIGAEKKAVETAKGILFVHNDEFKDFIREIVKECIEKERSGDKEGKHICS